MKVVVWEEMEDDYEEGAGVQGTQTVEGLEDAGSGVTDVSQIVPYIFPTPTTEDGPSVTALPRIVSPSLTTVLPSLTTVSLSSMIEVEHARTNAGYP